MIKDKLTPNELAKLALWDKMETVFYDGVEGSVLAGDLVTPKEEDKTIEQVNKKMNALRKSWGMDKIFEKKGWDR